jgi:predicted aspartyl protease
MPLIIGIGYTEIFGPSGSIVLRLALDTGATGTMINVAPLTAVGYDPSLVPDRIQVTTGSGVEFAPRIPVNQIIALGKKQSQFSVLAHTLPPSANIDGLLGLNFLRGYKVIIDFREGSITLN